MATNFFDRVLSTVEALTFDDRENIAEVSDMTALTPIALMGGDLLSALETETLHNINQFQLSMYAALWIKAASILLASSDGTVGETTVTEILAPLSDRRPRVRGDSLLTKFSDFLTDLSLEGMDTYVGSPSGSLLDEFDAEEYKEAELNKPTNLAVGKVIYVPLTFNASNKKPKEVKIPVTITLKPNVVDPNFLARLLAAFIGKDQSIMGRWNRWMAGEIDGNLTYLLGLDIIREDRRLRIEDKEGLFTLIKDNRSRGTIHTAWKGKKMNYNVASNMVLISDVSARQLETAMRGKFNDRRVRELFFKEVGCMMVSIVNTTLDTMTVYLAGQDTKGTYHLSDLKQKSTNGGPNDIQAMLKSFQLGQSFNL